MADPEAQQSATRRIEPYVLIPGIQRDELPKADDPDAFRNYVRKEPEPVDAAGDQLALRRWVQEGGYEKPPVPTLDPGEFPEGDIPEV